MIKTTNRPRLEAVIETTKLEARPYQVRIVQRAVNCFLGRDESKDGRVREATQNVLIESPTGSGKTPMGLMSAKYLQEELKSQGEKLTVVWVSMRRNLLKQAERENSHPSLENPDGKGIDLENLRFISMFCKDLPIDLLPENREGKLLLIHDEAQHDTANSAINIHDWFKPDFCLGLTATPFRADRVKLCFSVTINDMGIHQLIQAGYLSEYNHYTLDEWKPETVAKHYAADTERWGPSLAFFLTTDECRRCMEALATEGVPVVANVDIDGHAKEVNCIVTGDSDRERQILALERGQFNMLINMAVLTEGFNFPGLKTVWLRDSSKGPTIQMGGRVFRKFANISHKQVVQSGRTEWPMPRTATPDTSFVWQPEMMQWLSLKTNPMIDDIEDTVRLTALEIEVEMPDFIINRGKKRRKREG